MLGPVRSAIVLVVKQAEVPRLRQWIDEFAGHHHDVGQAHNDERRFVKALRA